MVNLPSTEKSSYPRKSEIATQLLLVALAYFVSGRVGLAIPYLDSHITLIWLPTGIAVAALMRWGYVCWPGIFLGALATNYSIDFSPLLDCCIALGNTLGPLLAVWLLRRLKFHVALDRAWDILLLAAASACGMLVSAGGGVASLVSFRVLPAQDAGAAWLSWWSGDFVGVLLAAPLLLNISRAGLKDLWAQRKEFLVWLAVMLASGWGVFFLNNDANGDSLSLVFILFPIVVWSAMRFRIMGSSLGVLLPAGIATVATSRGLGPFYSLDVQQGLFLLWLYLATLALVNLMVAALQAGRKRAEAALQQSEVHFREMFERHESIMLLIDPESGEIVDANASASRYYGYPLARLLHMNIAQINTLPPDEITAERTRAKQENRNYFIFPHRLASGEERTVEVHSSPIESAGHTLLFSIIHDITERRQAEQRLAESEQQLRSIIETEPECVKLIAKDGTVLQMNAAGLRMLEADTPEQIIGRKALGIVAPHHRDAFIKLMQSVFKGESGHLEFDVIGLKGGHSRLETFEVPMRDAQGRIIAMLGVTRDITERQRTQKETDTLLRRYQTLMKTALDGIRVMDIHGNILEANDSFCKMLGYTQEEASRLNVADWDAQWSKEELLARLKDFVGKSARFETVHRRKDGTLIDVEISTTGVDIEGHSIFFASSRDITERKETDAKLQRLIKLYDALNQCNQAIVRCTSEDDLLPLVCRYAVQFGGMQLAWIGLVDEATLLGHPVASYGTGTEYLDGIQVSVNAGEASGRGPFGTAFREQQPVWIQDFKNERSLAPWHERGARYGWAGVAALPLYRHGGAVGVLMLYTTVTDAFDEAARQLLEGMATDISYALTRFALLEERKQTENAIRIAAVTFETQEAILITDTAGKILRVNQAFKEITGYSAAEVVGQNPRILQSGRHDAAFFRDMWSALLDTGKWSGEIWDKRKNGDIYPKLMTITAVSDDSQCVTHYVAVFRDISNRKKSEDEIHQLAFYDSLTGLPNRRLLLDRLQQAMAAGARNGRYGALLFLDLDHFKTINDTRGHAMGDELLMAVARRLQTCVREGDSVARMGGDEFVVLLEDLSGTENEAAGQTESVAEKIRLELDKPYVLNDFECLSTVSIGISLFRGHLESAADLLQHTDVAMYQAKMAGRNAIRFFDPHMQTALETRAALEADLRHALEKQQFLLHYQIQVDNLGRPLGAEVLLRWDHPERGLVSPMEFIPLAEETGLIVPIGLWVLNMACAQLKKWQNVALTRDLTLAVNVSARQLRQPDFVVQVQRVLLETGARPSHLELELTESAVLDNVEDTISKMRELKLLGVGFSMDDFGTGYSSLQYLKRLPLDQIKIDQSFVRDIATDPNDAAIVQTIIAMTEALGLNVIAEGVETEAQHEFLDLRGCPAFQGYLFGKPVPIDQFEAALRGK